MIMRVKRNGSRVTGALPAAGAPEAASANGAAAEELLALRPRRRWAQETWVGLFVIIGVASALTALFTLTDAADFRGRDIVRATVTDAGGLRNGDPVQMRGVIVGRVAGFDMAPGGVEIRLELEDEYAIPADSRVVLRSNGILGGRIVDVLPGTAPVRARDGDRLAGASGSAAFDAPSLESLGGRAANVLAGAEALLSTDNVEAVGESTEALRRLIAELALLAAEQRAEVDALTESLRRSAGGVERAVAGPELARTVARADTITMSLERTSRTLDDAAATLATVLGRIERGEGTLGRLSADAALYDNLNAASLELTTLLRDVRANPSRYVDLSLF